MKSLSPQKQQIYDLYKSGDWVCSSKVLYMRDFRKRVSELNREGYTFESKKCDKSCGTSHTSSIHMYRMLGKPVVPVYYVKHPLTGERVTTEEMHKI